MIKRRSAVCLYAVILGASALAGKAAAQQPDDGKDQAPQFQSGLGEAQSADHNASRYNNRIRITRDRGVVGDLAPIVRIVSPLADASVALGDSRIGNGSPNGAGFVLNLEVVTRGNVPLALREATLAPPVFGIRHVDLLGKGLPNIDAPGLHVFFDTDLITPDGQVLPKFQDFASAFNVAGTDDTPGMGITSWLGWHVLESLPPDVNDFTITAAFVDEAGRIGMDRIRLKVDNTRTSGQALTPAPDTYTGMGSADATGGPEVTMIAPRVPTSIAIGPKDNSLNANNGALFFIQVTALDRSGAGIAVSETGIRADNPNVTPFGIIFDPTRIANATAGTTAGPNRNYPGLSLTFDVPLRQPNGNVVPAGMNLAPLFDVVGSEVDKDGSIRVTADWVVGGSLMVPDGKKTVTITAQVTDNVGRTGTARNVVGISQTVSGQTLTSAP